jgi:hypothetical protein
MPVFGYLPTCRQEKGRLPDPMLCTKVLAWTAPYAAVALHRILQLCTKNAIVDIEADSMSLKDADESIEEYPVPTLEGIDDFDRDAALQPTHKSSQVACSQDEETGSGDEESSDGAEDEKGEEADKECEDPKEVAGTPLCDNDLDGDLSAFAMGATNASDLE